METFSIILLSPDLIESQNKLSWGVCFDVISGYDAMVLAS